MAPSRVLLTSMSWERNHGVTIESDDNSHYPIGLAYLHSYLESKGHTVRTEWLNNKQSPEDETTLFNAIEQFEPDVIGFNVLTANRTSTFNVLNYIHATRPNILIVLGGIHATIMHRQILQKYPYVIIVIGEGELTFDDLINNRGKLDAVDGISYVLNGEIITTRPRELISDLDALPFPNHELFFKDNREFACILTSRGCPNRCSFCCLNPASPRKVRYRSVENVINEIEYLVLTYPSLKQIWIHDDSFFLDNTRVIEICAGIIKKKFNVSFVCSGRFKPITSVMILCLELANFKMVLLGLESGNDTILKNCHKGITKDDVRQVSRMFENRRIDLGMFLITGLPGETADTVKETYKFIQELQKIKYMYYHDIGILTVYPGTEIYENMKQHNLISDDYWMTRNLTPCYTVDHTSTTLMEFKEDTLDHISFDRILTRPGLKNQWKMIPYIIKYILTYKRKNIVQRCRSLLSRR